MSSLAFSVPFCLFLYFSVCFCLCYVGFCWFLLVLFGFLSDCVSCCLFSSLSFRWCPFQSISICFCFSVSCCWLLCQFLLQLVLNVSATASGRCAWQYCNPLEQEQRIASNPCLQKGWVHPKSGSRPVIIKKWRQGCRVEGIADFSDAVYIWPKCRLMGCLHLGAIRW